MREFLIGFIIGIILSLIIFIILISFMKPIKVGTIHRTVDTDGITYMSAEFTEIGIQHLNAKKTVVFDVSPIEFVAENANPIMDTRDHE